MRPYLLVLAFASFASGCATVDPGSVLLEVWQYAPDEDSRYKVVRGGRVTDTPNYDYYWLPTTDQSAKWDLSFAGKDGQVVNADVTATYRLGASDAEIIAMVKKYGVDLHATINGQVSSYVRGSLNVCASNMTVEDIYGAKKEELLGCVQQRVSEEFAPDGLVIDRIAISEIELPARVKEALEASIAASQEADKTRREVEQTKAEGEKKIAAANAEAEELRIKTQAKADARRIEAESEAAANATLERSVTPELLRLKELEIKAEQAKRWNGTLPTTIMGGDVPMIVDMK
jgi:regulator of protease activity HflC (stomatin/prohibitin superfamily)